LKIYKISGTFATYAPIYALSNEVGKRPWSSAGGPVRERGREKRRDQGLALATQDKVMSWGENLVSSTLDGGIINDNKVGQLSSSPSARRAHNEAALSTGDSGGGLFITTAASGSWPGSTTWSKAL